MKLFSNILEKSGGQDNLSLSLSKKMEIQFLWRRIGSHFSQITQGHLVIQLNIKLRSDFETHQLTKYQYYRS